MYDPHEEVEIGPSTIELVLQRVVTPAEEEVVRAFRRKVLLKAWHKVAVA